MGETVKKEIDYCAELDKYFPECGPCAFCGHFDKRHRIWDGIMGMVRAGDSMDVVARAYGLPLEAIQAVINVQPYSD